MKDSGCNDVLGLELNRVFFALGTETSKRKVIDFARSLLEAERQQKGFDNDRFGYPAAERN